MGIAAMQRSHRRCWITAGDIALQPTAILEITDKTATVSLSTQVDLPPVCHLFFTYNCTVGRKCMVLSQEGITASLLFLERIGAPQVPDNDNIVMV